MFIPPYNEDDRDINSLFGRKYLEEKSEEVKENADNDFSFKKHWKDDKEITTFDSKAIGGFKDW